MTPGSCTLQQFGQESAQVDDDDNDDDDQRWGLAVDTKLPSTPQG